MKIDKKNYKHWFVLGWSLVTISLIIVMRPFLRIKHKESDNKIIIFYGHTLNGNLRAFFDYLKREKGFKPYFLSIDSSYLKRLERA